MGNLKIELRRVSVLLLAIFTAGCLTQEVRVVDMTPPQQLEQAPAENELLDVGVAIFDANVPESYDEQIKRVIQPDLRRAEAYFMPYFAKNLLQSTGNWGAVRVVPRPTDAVDVIVTGKILHSDGESIELELTVRDASGAQWFSKNYTALASKYAYDDTVPRDIDPFQGIYKDLANDMLAYRQQLGAEGITSIRRTAQMKFASDFAPDAFDSYVAQNAEGIYELKKLPADSDPMVERVGRVREREYLFIDTLDEYFANFHGNMYPSYQSWRKTTYEEAIARKELLAQSKARTIGGAAALVSGVGAIYGSDNAYVDASGIVGVIGGAGLLKSAISKRAEAKIHAEVLAEVGLATEAELIPYTLELENQSVRLQGSVDEQYDQLRVILRKAFYEDLGLPVPKEDEYSQSVTEGDDSGNAIGQAGES